MKHFSTLVISFGILLVAVGFLIVGLTYYQLAWDEVSYTFFPPNPHVPVVSKYNHPKKTDIVPVDENFGIVIPKIRANSKVIANVDPFDPRAYQWTLTKGVAHAKGSSLPYENGTVFLFAHSSVDFYEAVRYNSIFYLLDKLQPHDAVYLFYKGIKYTYSVTGKTIVDPASISYLNQKSGHTLLLMTCYPPGTSFKRLLVEATLSQ